MNFYLFFLGVGICVWYIVGDFCEVWVCMGLNWFNCNYVGIQFGGSFYVMIDLFFMLMLMENLGCDYVVWDKVVNIEFVSLGKGLVYVYFSIDQKLFDEVCEWIVGGEKYLFWLYVEVCDDVGILVVWVQKILYVWFKLCLWNVV